MKKNYHTNHEWDIAYHNSSKMQEVVIRRTILRTAVLARPARATWINTPGNPGTFSLSRTHPHSGGSRGWVALDWQSENVFSSSSLLQTSSCCIFLVYITKLLPLSPGVEKYQVMLVHRCCSAKNFNSRAAFSLEVGPCNTKLNKLFKWSKWLGQSMET